MTDPIADIARATAHHLTTDYGPRLATDIEAALHTRTAGPTQPSQYTDPVAVAGLIVAIATLAWTVYKDLRKTTPQPTHETLTRTIRIQFQETHTIDTTTKKIIDITATEAIEHTTK
jgi:hypothetical protein